MNRLVLIGNRFDSVHDTKHSIDFRLAYQMCAADGLLRYASFHVADMARLNCFGSHTNLYFAYQCDLKSTPNDRREKVRQQGDKDRY